MLDFVLDFLFPPTCVICGKIAMDWICSNCENRLKKYEKFQLFKGKELNKFFYIEKNNDLIRIQNDNNLKYSDNIDNLFFDEFFYCFEYKKLIRKLLLNYKFKECSYLANFFANIMLNNKKINEIFENYDIIIPVPMDKNKKAIRGYNQTELITNIIYKNVNFNINSKDKIKVKNCLLKVKQNKTQSTLNSKERLQNVKNVFKIKNIDLKNKNIIIFDDICTTGATVNEISRILKLAGVNKILVLVIAKD